MRHQVFAHLIPMFSTTFVKNDHRLYEVTLPSQVKRIQDLLQEGPK